MRPLTFCALLLLAGCSATVPPKVVTEVRTVEVKVPVEVRAMCVKAEEVPPHPAYVMRVDADIRGLNAGAAAELKAWEGYYAKADALLRSCVKQEGK